MSTTTRRTDQHSPTNLVTEDYTFVGSYDANPTAYMIFSVGPNGETRVEDAPGAARARELQGMIAVSTESRNDGRCDHCGASIRYRAVLAHRPTGQVIQVGETCLDNRFSVATSEFKAMKKAAEEARLGQRIRGLVAAFINENPDLAWMASAEVSAEKAGNSYFIADIARKFREYGELSEKQVAAVRTGVVREAEFQARKAAAAAQRAVEEAARPHSPVVTGRVTVVGQVVSVREPDEFAQFPTWRMLVRDDRGFKVWGTVPSALTRRGNFYVSPASVKGERVSFSAEVEASKDDPEFGFYRRPTKAQVIAPAPEGFVGK